jgi:signal transduction histidine kinase
MNTTSRSFLQIRIIYVATTLFLVALSVYTFIKLKKLTDSYELVNHTNQVTQSLQSVLTSIIQAEDCKRGFLLSGDSLHLTKRDSALHKISKESQALSQLISDNPRQLKNLKVLNTVIADKVTSILDIPLPTERAVFNKETKYNTREGVSTMEKVTEQIDLMIATESSLLASRTGNSKQLSLVTSLFMIVFFIGALVILWTSYLKLTNALFASRGLQQKLVVQNEEKEKRAAELVIANAKLLYEGNEKENRSAELVIANKNLLHESNEKENRSAELIIANKKLHYESNEKENRAAELVIANAKLLYESNEKESRSAELIIANKKLHYESYEKERRAAELVIANEKLKHESSEKENRAAELVIANTELAFQIEEKEKRAAELISTNKELQLFAQIASHDLQEPLRKIQMFTSRIKEKDLPNISESGKTHFAIIEDAAERMQVLIQDLIAYAQTNDEERSFEETNLTEIINEVTVDLSEIIAEKDAIIETDKLCSAYIIPFQFRQLMTNLISNSLKFAKPEIPCHIVISSQIESGNPNINKGLLAKKKYCHIAFSDNGIGFEAIYNEKIFEIFQRLHGKGIYKGTGIGLAIVKKIIDNHKGIITAVGKPNEGATFDIYLPTK